MVASPNMEGKVTTFERQETIRISLSRILIILSEKLNEGASVEGRVWFDGSIRLPRQIPKA